MKRIVLLLALATGTLTTTAAVVSAQECPCDCYFSGDCAGGFCNWGSLPVEDSCFWRTPKPQGQVGAGCNQDYGSWGQCDGICTASNQSSPTPFTGRDIAQVTAGIAELTDGLLVIAAEGGGTVDLGILEDDPDLRTDLLRVVQEIALLVAPAIIDMESGPGFRVRAVHDAAVIQGITLATEALLAEIGQTSGSPFVEQIDPPLLDNPTLNRLCQDNLAECLTDKIHDMSRLFAPAVDSAPMRSARGAGCTLLNCPVDINNDDTVDANDLAMLLGDWGGCNACRADYNNDQLVDAADLATLLGAWGPCGLQ